MSQQGELSSYIARLQTRLRVSTSLRGAALLAAVALVLTIALVYGLNHYAFPAQGVTRARYVLIVSLLASAALGLLVPLLRLTRTRAVSQAEARHPELEQRLTTFHERQREEQNPFLELLAADTLQRTASSAPPSSLAPLWQLGAFSGAAVACIGVLAWIISSGPGYLGYGASLLWTGPKTDVAPLYSIAVTPGDVAVRRNTDQLIAAHIAGLRPDKVQLFARFQSAGGWEPVPMQADVSLQGNAGSTGNFQFLFTGLPEDVEYYVAAGPLTSSHYKVRVVDLPSVKAVQVTYNYPKWTGLKPATEEHAGDLRALEGTDAVLEIEMDKPLSGNLSGGQLTLDNGKIIHLTASEGNRYKGTVHMDKDGAYHVAAIDGGQPVRLSEDYFIATEKAQPPEVALDRPGRDYRASPIEEVTVGVKASDTFGLSDMHLHYSVNGGGDHDLNLLKAPGTKSAEGSYTVRLEDFKLVPGDLVSLYATARDGHAEARTEMTFIQAEPFGREFSQSQQSPGSGGGKSGGGNNQTEISKREKELIAATWKQANDKTANPKDAAAQGQFLTDAQTKLRDQVTALSARMGSRDISSANEEFSAFEKDMQAAASTMAPSADKLKGMQWKDALPLEEKTLQSLLRAEATFRQIQVAFGQQSAGSGGGGESAGRDLASLFDLELDTEKNQYETAQTASPAEQHAKDVEDALEKLDALAKRQEELASQQHNPQQSFEQRWQQEMLRREAEQLQRHVEQLAQNNSGQQGAQAGREQSGQQESQEGRQQGAQTGSQSGSQSGSPSSAGGQQQTSSSQPGFGGESDPSTATQGAGARSSKQQGGRAKGLNSNDQRISEALSRLRQAGDAMKRSGSAGANREAAQQMAAERLREATSELGGVQQQLSSGKVEALAREAGRLNQQERAQADRIAKLAGRQSDYTGMDAAGMTARVRERNQLAAERQQLSNDLSALGKNLRDTARQMAPNQPGVAGKLRDALTEMDQTDLDNHVQRTADWLRRGVNPNSNGTETEIGQGLQKLDTRLQQAQAAMGQGAPGKLGEERRAGQSRKAGDQVAALNQVERLRSQLEAMAASRSRDGSRNGATEQGGPEQQSQQRSSGRQPGENGNPPGQAPGRAQQPGGQGQPGRSSVPNRQGQQAGSPSASKGNRGGSLGNSGNTEATHNGEVRVGGGGGADGTTWNNINTGNNQYAQSGQRTAPHDASGIPADAERTFQQGMRELSQLRQMVGGDPAAARDVGELTRHMQRLDPASFPGNPAMVEQMHREVLSAVDRLELQLHSNGSTGAHTSKPEAVPSGYEQSVAAYYRGLSSRP